MGRALRACGSRGWWVEGRGLWVRGRGGYEGDPQNKNNNLIIMLLSVSFEALDFNISRGWGACPRSSWVYFFAKIGAPALPPPYVNAWIRMDPLGVAMG